MACMTECASLRIITSRPRSLSWRDSSASKTYFQPAIPHGHELFARFWSVLEFGVAIAIGLFAVGGQEIAPPRAHVANHVLDDDGDGVGFGIERGEKIFVGTLVHGALGERFVVAKKSEGILDVERRKFVWHRWIVGRGRYWRKSRSGLKRKFGESRLEAGQEEECVDISPFVRLRCAPLSPYL